MMLEGTMLLAVACSDGTASDASPESMLDDGADVEDDDDTRDAKAARASALRAEAALASSVREAFGSAAPTLPEATTGAGAGGSGAGGAASASERGSERAPERGAERAPHRQVLEDASTLVRNFVDTVLVKGDRAAAGRFLGNTYAQHGSAPSAGAAAPAPLRYPVLPDEPSGTRLTYQSVQRVVTSGQLVMVESAGLVAGIPSSFNDLFRVENGRIVERWHAPQPGDATLLPRAD
jgi:predicted SnoaL-like aldol condensation-catalyzing enzyme